MKVTELHIYPIKSCAGLSLREAQIGERGFEHDREWMITDKEGLFISQRQYSKLATIKPEFSEEILALSAPTMPSIKVPIRSDRYIRATVWENECKAYDQGDEVSQWLEAFLGKETRLVRMAPDFVRFLKEKYRKSGTESVGFADSMPFHLTSEASLNDLNSKLSSKLPMDRFRPNIVIDGAHAFEEDKWKRIRIGKIEFRIAKPCDRCEITTVDQTSGEKGIEPLETLGTYRSGPKGIMFGMLMIHEGTGKVSVGDEVEILE